MRHGSFKSWLFDLLLILGGATFFSLVTFASSPRQAQELPPSAKAPATQASGSEFKLRLQSNVVVVRVVVRDKKGRAVSGLRKQDFRIRDNKKPQAISGFSVERPGAVPVAGAGRKAIAPSEAPVSYLAFYFDDLYSAMGSIARARKAAE